MGFFRPRLRSALLALVLAGGTTDARAAGARDHRGDATDDARDSASAAEPATSGVTHTFPYRQKRYLYSRNGAGGLAYVTSGAKRGEALPVVVFLHGMNPDAHVHPWFAGPHGDLRQVSEGLVHGGRAAPFVLAAPTHTRYATGATVMWPGFDLGDFLDVTQAALGETAQLDRARVVVVGHSAAGCNPRGGLLADGLARARPAAVVAIDTCLDDKVEPGFRALAEKTKLHFYWQRSWSRPFAELQASCPACDVTELTVLAGAPHQQIVVEALSRALPALLPPKRP